MSKYLLDTNFFLDSSLKYYQNDFFQDFWEWIGYISQSPSVKTINKVKQELDKKDDFISDFIKSLPKEFFIDERNYIDAYAQIIQKSQNMNFNQSAKENFAKEHKADAWLIAVALKDGYTVVSNEKIPDKKEKKNIKIPRMCQELNIRCVNIFDFIKEQKVQFKIENIYKGTLL